MEAPFDRMLRRQVLTALVSHEGLVDHLLAGHRNRINIQKPSWRFMDESSTRGGGAIFFAPVLRPASIIAEILDAPLVACRGRQGAGFAGTDTPSLPPCATWEPLVTATHPFSTQNAQYCSCFQARPNSAWASRTIRVHFGH